MKTQLKMLYQKLLQLIGPAIQHKTYQKFTDAVAACKDSGYSNSDLTKIVIDKNIIFKQQLNSSKNLDLSALRTLIGIAPIKIENNTLKVIDFGGGGGYHHTIANHVLGTDMQLQWNVVETTEMANEGQRLANHNLKFFDDLSKAVLDLGSVDLVFTSSVLQYCPDPLAYLKQLTEINSKYIYITKTPFINGDGNIISTQYSKLSHNGPGPLPPGYHDKKIMYPITYSSKISAEKILQKNYDIRFAITEDKSVFRVGNQTIDLFGYFCARKN